MRMTLWQKACHMAAASLLLAACAHAPMPEGQARRAAQGHMVAARMAMDRAQHGPAALCATQALAVAEATLCAAERSLAGPYTRRTRDDVRDLSYLTRRRVQLAESLAGRHIALVQTDAAMHPSHPLR